MKGFIKTVFISLLFILGLAYILLQSPPVQNYILKKVTTSFEEKAGTKVSIGNITIDFFHGVKLKEVLICDAHLDTILYAGALTLDVNYINLSENKIRINYLELKKANIKLQRHKEDKRWAYLVFLDNFKSKQKKTTKTQADWAITIDEIKLSDCIFQNINEHARRNKEQFDQDYIRISAIDATINDVKVFGDTTRLRVNKLSALEQCGFKISKLSSLVTMAPGEMNFSELDITTPFSHVKDQFIMRFDSIEDFDDFISKVRLDAHFDQSTVSFDDLQYFSSELRGMHQLIKLSGNGKGPVDNLKLKNVAAYFGANSYFKGNLAFKGLPDLYETFFDIVTKDASLNKADLEYLLSQTLPDEVGKLGKINYQMKAVGFIRDFVLDGNFNTLAGNIKTDINFKFPQDKTESYSGSATLNKFNLGKITGNNLLEELDGKLSVNGSGLEVKTINTKIDAELNSLQFNGYTYKNIIAHGTLANKLFQGKALVADENLKLDFDGTIDYSKAESIFDFTARIGNANLLALHLDSSNSVLNAEVSMKLRGNSITNIYGTASIPFISYLKEGKKYEFKNLSLASKLIGNKRSISITSDVVNASIDGNYNFNDLPEAVLNECNLLYPDYFKATKKVSKQNFVFIIDLKKPEEFISLLNPKLELKPTTANGYFNSETHAFALNLKSGGITYDSLSFDLVTLNAEQKTTLPFKLLCTTGKINRQATLWATEVKLDATGTLNKIVSDLTVTNAVDSNSIYLESTSDFMPEGIAMQFNNSGGVFSSVAFNFSQKEPLLITKDGISFHEFKVKSLLQEVALDGKLTKNAGDQLKLSIQDFELKTLNALIKNMGVKLYGKVNGNFTISNPFYSSYIATDPEGITVKNFQVDKDTFGNLKINSVYNKSDNLIYSTLSFTDGDLQNLSIDGRINPAKKTNNIDFDIEMDEVPLKNLNFVFKGLASNLQGSFTGKAKLTGSFNHPELEGKAFLKEGSFQVDYLKTTYLINHEVIIHKNRFEIRNAKLYDENKKVATLNAKVTHDNFGDWAIDVAIRNLSGFKILNTNSRDNDMFYGVGYATGDVSMVGPIDNIKMVMNLKSNKGTVINLPLSNPEYSSKSSYITFKDKSQKNYKKYQVTMSGLELEINLDINEDAYIKLIFDSQLGDIIEGTGTGLIKMNISPTGDFSMYGYYEIENGKYVFTKYDIFNKPFIVKSGGRITWDGDPYGAKVNLEAVYLVSQANASSLLQTTATSSGSTDVAYIPVNCILFLKGLLFRPDITFNLEIPKLQNFINPQLENTVKTYISSWQQNPDELNRQVFSLLFFKRFFPLDNVSDIKINSGINTSVGDLITSQLTNLLGQVFTNVPIGIDYNKSDNKPAGIWIFKLSKKFFDDRLVLEGNYVYDQTQASNVTGNISAQVLIDRTGQIRFTVFSKRANNKFTDNQNVLTNGVGFYWRTEFNTFRRKKKAVPFVPEPTTLIF